MEVVGIIVAALISSLTTIIVMHFRCGTGTLRIDHSNPKKDLYRFDIDDLDQLNKKKRLILTIDHNADLSYLSQK